MFHRIPIPGAGRRHPEHIVLAFLARFFALAVVIGLFVLYVSGVWSF